MKKALSCLLHLSFLHASIGFVTLGGPKIGANAPRIRSLDPKWGALFVAKTHHPSPSGGQSGRNHDAEVEEFESGAGSKGKIIPPETLNELKESVSIVSVVESFNLPKFQRKSDTAAVALCPFHDDKNPSLHIDDTKRIFKCFSCGAGGDVFRFVREYNNHYGDPMTFFQSVMWVAENFGDESSQASIMSAIGPRMSEEERTVNQFKRRRLYLCNAVAAGFFAKNLVGLTSAGGARGYLRSRGISPKTVQAFALGYAPETYFDPKIPKGKGSLVAHLKAAGFSRAEIVESGLAKPMKKPGWDDVVEKQKEEEDIQNDELSDLMDRFRGRVMVPIFGGNGKIVVGFGGRILPKHEEASKSNFKPPKYMNSPESIVFHKGKELFGVHIAKKALNQATSVGSPSYLRRSIVIVEGYMDVIALWEIGVQEAVASMGTSLSQEQLSRAAKAVGITGGRIVLCLDNDEAGRNAVERLCAGSFLTQTTEQHGVEIMVAELPPSIKDPGEYIESSQAGSKDEIAAAFRKEVIERSKHWIAWQTARILSRYDANVQDQGPGSFQDICDKVSDFLSKLPNPADRTKRAHDIASSLASLVAKGTSSQTLQVQLESDLVDMVSRKAAAKDALARRIESVNGYDAKSKREVMAKMARGEATTGSDLEQKLSGSALRALRKSTDPTGSANFTERVIYPAESEKQPKHSRRRRRIKMKRIVKQDLPLTPYFDGFDISSKTDATWMGVSQDKSRQSNNGLTLGNQKDQSHEMRERKFPSSSGKPVYFNSNLYHGRQILTDEAAGIGYKRPKIVRDPFIFEHGVGTLIRENHNTKTKLAEETLLWNLVHHMPARDALVAVLTAGEATRSRPKIRWSNYAREWLFQVLVIHSDALPPRVKQPGKSSTLREYLANRIDVPEGAFRNSLPMSEAHRKDKLSTPHQTTTDTDLVPFEDSSEEAGNKQMINPLSSSQQGPSNDIQQRRVLGETDDLYSLTDPDADEELGFLSAESIDSSEAIDAHALVDGKSLASNLQPRTDDGGFLDFLFQHPGDCIETSHLSMQSERAELEVQAALATLLRSDALNQLTATNSRLLVATRLLENRLALTDPQSQFSSQNLELDSGDETLDAMDLGDLNTYRSQLFAKLQQAHAVASYYDLAEQRLSARLLDLVASAEDGGMPKSAQEQFTDDVNEFMRQLPDDYQPRQFDGFPGHAKHNQHYNGSSDAPSKSAGSVEQSERTKERFATDMVEMNDRWKHWKGDDYSWSIRDADEGTEHDEMAQQLVADLGVGSIEEDFDSVSPEEAIARLDSEWGHFDDDSDDEPVTTPGVAADEVLGRVPKANVRFGAHNHLSHGSHQATNTEKQMKSWEDDEMTNMENWRVQAREDYQKKSPWNYDSKMLGDVGAVKKSNGRNESGDGDGGRVEESVWG